MLLANKYNTEENAGTTCRRGRGATRTHTPCWGAGKMVQPWRAVWHFLKKVNVQLPYDLASILLGSNTDLFIIAQNRKQAKCPLTDEWLNNCVIFI